MDIFKLEQNLSLSSGVPDVKVTTPEVTFDTSTDFNLSFFDSASPPPPSSHPIIKKEVDFDEKMFDAVASDSIFSSSGDFSPFTTEDSKYTTFADSVSSMHADSNLSPASTQNISSPLPSPGITQAVSLSQSKMPVVIKTEQSYQVADSTPSPSPAPTMKSFVPCKVCGDKASGYHYGVTSCEGCKGFFRRSIQKQIEYRCLRDGKCLVIRLNRNRCQYCRFKKCLSVGMSRDSVRYGRVPKRTRERENSSDSRGSNDAIANDPIAVATDNRQLLIYDIILKISQAFHANCPYTEEKTRSIVKKPIIYNTSEGNSDPETATSTLDALEQQKINLWQSFGVFVTPSVQKMVEFAKRVPGFTDLSQDDQLILIKGGFFELWLLQGSRLISSLDNTLTFYDGSFFTRHQVELMFDHEFTLNIFNFSVSFNSLNLNDTEIGLFAAIVLLTAERPGITDTKSVEQFQDKIIEAMRVQIGRNHSTESHLFTTIITKLPELRQIGIRSNDHLNWFRANWSRLKLPPLFAEIFDIPKSEDDLL